ncbi:hypothetical protein PAXRUDRAFT_834849, partial [Paxillus rubicundulus Ve08.2h10]
NRQDIETLQDHIKIRQWHHTGPGAKNKNIKHKLMLKWWEVEVDSSKLVDKSLPPAGRAAPRPRLELTSLDAEIGGGVQEGDNMGGDAEIVDGNDWLDERRELDPAAVGAERLEFTLGGRTDIESGLSYLRDILSDTDTSQTQMEASSTSSKDPGGGSGVAQPPPASKDWDSWE